MHFLNSDFTLVMVHDFCLHKNVQGILLNENELTEYYIQMEKKVKIYTGE